MSSAARTRYPHETLLLACVASRDSDIQQRLDAALSAPELDWPTVLRTAVQHGVVAMLAWHLRPFAHDPRVPASIMALMERIEQALAARNRTMFEAASRLVRALDLAGIPYLMLKGVGVALTLYPRAGSRSFADIDILVPEAQWAEAGRIATEVGFLPDWEEITPKDYHLSYAMYVPEDILSDTLVPEFEPKHRPEALGDAIHRVVVEIHRSIFNLPNGFGREVDMGPFWENPQNVDLPDGTPIRIPGPEAQIVHLASHANRHSYWRLIFALDIVQALQTWGSNLDWELVAALADRYAARNAVYRMVELAHREFAATVPSAALRLLDPGPDAGPAGAPLDPSEIFGAMDLCHEEYSAITLRLLLTEGSLGKALLVGGRILFPVPSIMRRYYHVQSPVLIAGCYLIRPFQLGGRLVRVLCRMLAARVRRSLARRSALTPANQDSQGIL